MSKMSPEEMALEKARERLGDLVAQTIVSSGMDRAELERRIHVAEIDVYRADLAAQEAHRRALLAIVDQQATPEVVNNPQLARVLDGLRRGITREADRKIEQLKFHLEEALRARKGEGQG
jgi:hypothetical protein